MVGQIAAVHFHFYQMIGRFFCEVFFNKFPIITGPSEIFVRLSAPWIFAFNENTHYPVHTVTET